MDTIFNQLLADLGSDAQGFITIDTEVIVLVVVIGAVLGMIYPFLALLMLNKDPVRQHLK
jgi:hypothetical protein